MKRLSFLIVAVCLLSLCCSAFADKVTNVTEGITTQSGDTIKAAYATGESAPATQTLRLSDNVTETESTTPVFSSDKKSTITLQSDGSTVRTITTATPASGSAPLSVFENNTDGATIDLTLNNVAITGSLITDSETYKSTVNLSGESNNLTLTGLQNSEGFVSDYNGGAISGYNGVTISNTTTDINISGYNVAENGGAIYSLKNVTIGDTSNAINSLTFNNNNSGCCGGAIYAKGIFNDSYNDVSDGDVSIINVTGAVSFTYNTVNDGAGGAISAGHDVTIGGNDVTIGDNVETKAIGSLNFDHNSGAYAGAISAQQGNVSISNVKGAVSFTYNSATNPYNCGNGGAISSGKDIIIGGSGGAIGSLAFSNNSTDIDGGALFAIDNISISNVIGAVNFTNNTALSSDSSSAGSGGAISALSKDVTIGGSGGAIGSLTFNNNHADRGGAICSYSENVCISNVSGAVSFTNNTALYNGYYYSGDGGAIYASNKVTIGDTNTTDAILVVCYLAITVQEQAVRFLPIRFLLAM